MSSSHQWDVVVVGSGFGGSVTALRLAEKGYRVLVCEAGRRFADDEHAMTSWDLRNFLWQPALGLYGIQRFTFLNGLVALSGAGVGGGSLNYSGTLFQPGDAYYLHPQWARIADWRSELAPFYDQARRMLGVNADQPFTEGDEALRRVAERMGAGDTFTKVPVGILNTPIPGQRVADPYFGGVGPDRQSCVYCGACMTGCRHNAKNTLPKNYLHLAERAGATIAPMTTVKAVQPRTDGGYAVETVRSGPGRRPRKSLTAGQVVFAAGVLETQRLLQRMKLEGHLADLSDRLGTLTRTNAESLGGATAGNSSIDFSDGVCQGTSFFPDEHTHVEIVRNGKGSNTTSLLMTVMTPGNREGGPQLPRWRRFLTEAAKHPGTLARSLWVRRWSERGLITLTMEDRDCSLTVMAHKNRLGGVSLRTQPGPEPPPRWIPIAQEVTALLAEEMGGEPFGTYPDVLEIPATSHVLGGCVIGADADSGVIDGYHRVYGYPGLHIVDGSTVTANLGVNPALTITAQAERATAMWPNAGQPDTRPPLGEEYHPVAFVAPLRPAVPAGAPGELRLPVT
ncbi:MAG: FAD-dependent oxidoreductase [Acidimicrobiales bacterium]